MNHMGKEAENMRSARKREILNFIESLHLAHGEIRDALQRDEQTSVQTMLAECQEFAIELGNAIEETEGENCVTVSYVEEYCETLFRVFGESGTDSSANRVYKILNKELLRIENSVKNDISIRKEIVFFPYKAAMWDSLESIYLAAKEDPDCDVYCVPIPYFELNEDESYGPMHYEGDLYPENIEITDWQAYQLEERRPDVVFIHNPYDDWNLVSRVHPRYYTQNLKKYTDLLVYIPYFILDEITQDDPDRQEKIEKMRNYCFVPGTIYADKIVVQSENMRQIYIEQYLQIAKQSNTFATRRDLEQRILGIGSPKMDKVANTQKKDLDIPEEWLRIIRKPNGDYKKVVFYNTCVKAMLCQEEKWIDKIENVIKIFKDNQEETALLWRPHPLIESAVKSLRSDLLERYLGIRDRYIEEGWGIYDDTADLNRAIAVSDAYYGDRSSVVQLYKQTGKPIMLQDVEKLYG